MMSPLKKGFNQRKPKSKPKSPKAKKIKSEVAERNDQDESSAVLMRELMAKHKQRFQAADDFEFVEVRKQSFVQDFVS